MNTMKKTWLSWCVLSLALTALAGDIGTLRPLQISRIGSSDKDQSIHVQEAIRLGDRYLAVVMVTSRTREGRERLRRLYGVPAFLAAAWFSHRWELLRLGDGLFATPGEVTPIALRGWEPTLLDYLGLPRRPVYRFPKVLVRAAGASWCPYLLVTTTQIACLDETLRLGARWETPIQVMDYFVWQGDLWMAGYHEGHLLHRVVLTDEDSGPYEVRPVQIDRSILALEDLRAFLTRQGFTPADLRDLDPSTWTVFVERAAQTRQELAENPQKLESMLRKDREGRRYIPFGLHRALRPFHFPMAATVQEDRAYVVFHRPFGIAVIAMPEGQVLDFRPLRREDLPMPIQRYTHVAVWNVRPVRDGHLFLNVCFERDIPYRELQATDPAQAAELARTWADMRRRNCSDIVPCDAPLTPETVVDGEWTHYGLEVTDRGTLARLYPLDWSDGRWSRSVLAMAFFPTPAELWLSVRTEEGGYVVRGVARFDW